MLPLLLIYTLVGCETAPKANPTVTPSKIESLPSEDVDPPPAEETANEVEWDPKAFNGPTFMTDALKDALYKEDWDNALPLVTSSSPEAKILSTWLAIQSNKTQRVAHNYDVVTQYDQIPEYHRAFM